MPTEFSRHLDSDAMTHHPITMTKLTVQIALQSAVSHADHAISRPKLSAESRAYVARCKWARAVRESEIRNSENANAKPE